MTRIVYDGAPEAGKTTNLHMIWDQVGKRREGSVISPHTTGRQTQYFDWIEFPGGFLDGRRIQCQVLSVPGQESLLSRRKLLLDSADVIVFVVDSCAEGLAAARKSLAFTLTHIRRSQRPIGLLVQANKQDLPGAIAPEELLRELTVTTAVSAIGAASKAGQGVMYTLVMAARLAVDRARELLSQGQIETHSISHRGVSQLLDAMLGDDQPAAPPTQSELRTGTESHEFGSLVIPDPVRIGTGQVWPVAGRQHFVRATSGRLRWHSRFFDDVEVVTVSNSDGWRLHTFPSDVFESELGAQNQLIATAQQCRKFQKWIDPGLAIAVYPDARGWRIWTAHRANPSLREALVATRTSQARSELLEQIRRADIVLDALTESEWLRGVANLDTFVVEEGALFLQAVRHQRGTSPVSLEAAAELVLSHSRSVSSIGPAEAEQH